MLFTVPDNPADDQRFMMTLYKKIQTADVRDSPALHIGTP